MNTTTCSFQLDFIGDGSSVNVVASLNGAPFGVVQLGGPTFFRPLDFPTAIINCLWNPGTGGQSVSASISNHQIVTFTLSGGVPISGQRYSISGDMLFS